MTLNELSLSLGYGGVDFMNGDTVLEGATITESVNGDGGLSLSWKSDVATCIAAGTECCGFIMMEPYAPSLSSDGIYQHSPKFSDRSALLGKTLFYKTIKTRRGDVEEDIPLYTFSFYGPASEIISALDVCADGFNVGGSGLGDDYIFVSFDGDTVKSAAQKIADACDCEVLYNGSGLTIGHAGNYAGEYYNRFVVLGGTKNLAKVTSKGMYAAITQRLTLDPSSYPGSIINTGGGTPMTKMLIFDDIYPKMELKITNVRWRECWLFDENGEKIPDGAGGAYKTYRKYYIKLAYTDDDSQYFLDTKNVIQDKVLGIVFQAGSLAGREFELTYFADSVREYNSDEDLSEGVTTEVGEFRIICQAVNEYLLPSAEFAPLVGQIVTLSNVRFDEHFTVIARAELLSRGQEYAAMYNGGGSLSHSEERVFPDFLTGGGSSAPAVPSGQSVTSVTTDLITGTQTVQYGTFQPKGKLASMADKIDGASTGGSGTVAQEDDDYVPAQIGNDNLKVLMEAGCNTGIRTVNTVINNIATELENIGADVTQIQSQADQKMQLWFGTYVPTASNYPANQWLTDAEKQLHTEDVFYNYNREANNPNGGKAWRWTRHENTAEVEGEAVSVVTYSWELITDADTLQALEKIADVAYDGKLAGGSEKVRVYTQWQQAVGEHAKYNHLASAYGLVVNRYNAAYRNLAKMLNGGVEGDFFTDILSGAQAPAWLSDLNSTTAIILDSGFVEGIAFDYQDWSLDTSDAETAARVIYRKLWNEYYAQAEALDRASKVTANVAYKNVTVLADDGTISAGTEKSQLLTLWRETVAEFWKLLQQAEDYGLHGDTPTGQGLNKYQAYCESYCILAWMLNDDQEGSLSDYIDADGKFLESLTDIFLGEALPSWIGTDFATDTRLSETEIETADAYRTAWNGYHSARANLLKRIEEAAKTATDHAQTDATSALGKLSDMANDLKITPDEKRELRKQWTAWATEYDNFLALFTADPVINALSAVSAYKTAFANLGGFLNNPSDINFPAEGSVQSYAALQPTMIWANTTTTLTTAQATQYKQCMTAFLAARTAMLTALSTQNISFFVSATPPAPPFFIGDRWLWLNHLADGRIADGETINTDEYEALPATDTMMVCTQALSVLPHGQSGYTVGDYWAEASKVFAEVEPDPRNLLAALADRLYVLYGSNAANFPIDVSLDANDSTATPNNGSSDDDGNVASLLSQLQTMIGDADFGVFIQTPLDAQKYDMLCVPVTCSIPGGNGESITGGIQIKMYNGTKWEYIQESTSSLLESLGNKILAMVFGSNAAATEAAGLTVGQRFAKLFAQATVYDPDNSDADANGFVTLSQALFGIEIEADANGRYHSTAMISADHIDFTGYTFHVNASNITFDTSIGAGNIDFTTGNFTINADHIDFTTGNFTINADHIDFTGYTFHVNASNITFDTSIGAGNIDFTTDSFHIDASHIVITDNGSEVAIIENGKIRASLIDVTNLNVLGALTGQTIDMQNATFQNLHVSGEVTGIVTAEQLFQNLTLGQASKNYKLTMDNDDEVLISETNIAILQGFIGEIWDYVGENQDIPRTVVKVEYYGNKDTDIFYASTNGQRIYVPNPELSEGRTIEIYNGTGGSFTLASSAAPPCTSASETWGSPRSDLFFYATKTSASAGNITTNAVYMKLHAGKRVESGSSVEKLYWIILEQRNADGTIYFP